MLIALAVAGVSTGACGPSEPGHLEVPRGMAVCAPAGQSGQVLFGVLVTHDGKDPITITTVHAEDTTNVRDVSIMVDLEGAADDDVIGTARNPAEDPARQPAIDALLGRLVEAQDALVAPGSAANLIVVMSPEDARADAEVGHLAISYREHGLDRTVSAEQRLTLAAAGGCDGQAPLGPSS